MNKSRLLNVSKKFFGVLRNSTFAQHQESSLKSRQKELMARGLPKKKPINGVKHIVLVSSGKGGVGKSTTAVNLSIGLKLIQPEKKIGLLDADIFGPTVPLMMNLHDTPFLTDKDLMEPLVNYGVKCMSFGFLIDEDAPVIWRGLMVMQALEKLMRHVEWGDIDYLIVDTPPGTGDTHLSLVQNLPISGVVLVTSPQTAALQVTKRGAVMYNRLKIPLIGLVENMCSVVCPSCSNNIRVFGDGTRKLAEDLNIDILESFPLNSDIADGGDKGVPIVLDEGNRQSGLYRNVAQKVVEYLKDIETEQAVK
ncbi:iron-sulfur protein NUBPL [Anthonomus grandis grandis]|uniref:iron-sulfur protein NUBPL n=1 Tax=Anthonomus grandis grandis TaxID=2921223 RepID=UPI0021661B26|nr:iron-sulfur protein NUBPL [Anthonomus grandis grandis]